MKIRISRMFFLAVALSLSFSALALAQTQQFEKSRVKPEDRKAVEAKREIIKVLFANIFRGESKETISLSTKNIPLSLQKNFPKLPNLTAEIVSEGSAQEAPCPFVFHSFSISDKKATLSFGDCTDGLGYNFEKIKGKWRFASLEN